MKIRAGLKFHGRKPTQTPTAITAIEGREVRALEEAVVEQLVGIQEQRGPRDDHDARGEAVEPVDEVDGVGEDHDRDHRDERREVGREHDDVGARERDVEEQHRDAEQRQQAPGQHHPGDLGRRRHVPEVVERAGGEHHARRQDHARRLGRAVEHLPELRDLRRHADRDEEADEHRRAAELGDRRRVHVACRRDLDRADAEGELPHQRGSDERRRARDGEDDRVPAHGWLGPALPGRRVSRESG